MEKSEVRFFKILPFINIVLSFLIVIHHSFNINIDYNVNIKNVAWIIERYLYNITECAVPIFFFMSAVLFYRDFHGELETFKRKVKNRVKSLLLPYIIFNIIGYIKHIVFANQDFGLFRLLGSIITSDTMPLWFLRELFILSILAPILYKLKSKRNVEYFVNFFIIILIITGILLFFIGELLGDTLENLCNIFGVSEVIVGILLGFVTSLPELITFFESQRHYKKVEDDMLGVVEATNNLLTSNILNLFAIQTVGILISTIIIK